MPKTKAKRPSGLHKQIEREVTHPSWSPFAPGEQPLDPTVQEHLEHFLTDVDQIPPLEEFSLLTPESAQAALQKLQAAHAEIQRKMRTAQALRKLLEQQRKH